MQQGLEPRRSRSAGGRPSGHLVLVPLAVLLALSVPLSPALAQNVTVGELPNGGSITIEIVVTAPAPAPAGIDAFSTQGTVSGGNFPSLSTDDPDTGGTDDPTLTLLAAVPDLTIDKSYTGPTPLPGDTVAFDLAFTNDGNQGATGVTIAETVPLHSTFNAGASSGVWSCADGSPAGTPCNLVIGGLAGGGTGASAVFAVDLVNPLPPGASELVNTASIADDAANGTDPNPGDNSDTVIIGLDSIAPTVVQVDAVPATADGELTDCETVTAPIGGFALTFSEDLQDPPGDTDPNDVTNPDNYLLVAAGPNAAYDTFACGGAGGDDVAIPIAAVAYDSVADVATLDAGGTLGPALHRLLVCDTLRDVAGNAMVGFERSFRADPGNLFANGHLDCDQADWTATSSGGATITHDPAVDGDASPDSGSSQATLLSPGVDPAAAAITQCLPVVGGEVALEGRARLAADPDDVVSITVRCDFFAAAACAGGLAGTGSTSTVLGDTGGGFVDLGAELDASGAISARCGFHWGAAAGIAFDGWLDALTAEAPIFADGFESGDTAAWSGAVP